MSTETTTPPAAPAPAAAAAATAAPANAGGSAPFAPQPAASLYVGELDPSVTEAFLFEMFNVIGPVASVRVCRDAVTRRSLGYAYVNFHHQADGERALEQLNYTAIKGRPCRIMWSQRDPSMRRSGAGNVFIKNLDATIDNKALHDTFSAFGKILSCKVAFGKDGQSLGYGFVHYETREAAQAAIDAVNGMLLNDKEVFVGFHVSRREREAEMVAKRAQFTNLYVKNLPEDVTDDEFHAMFAEFGSVLSAVVQRDEEGNSKGFGFVNYAKHEEAHAAVAALNGKELRDKELYVARAQKKGEREEELRRQYEAARQERMQKYQGNNVYIKNLDDETDDDQLRNEFAQFGTITSCKVMRDEKGMSRGFGFVCFSTPDEATAAVTEMNGKILGTKPLYVALAQRKEQRRQQLEAQYAQRMTMGMPFRMGPGAPMLPPGMAPYPGMPPMYYPAPPGARPFYGQPPMGPPGPQGVPRSRWPAPMPGAPGMPGGPMPYPMQYAPMPGAPGMPGAPMPPMGMPGQGMRGGRGGRGGMMRGGAQGRMQRPPMQQQQQPQQAAPAPAQAPLNPNEAPARPSLATLVQAASSVDEKKQLLGEALYPLIAEQEPEHAPKITGMLLEMEPAEVLALFESRDELRAKVQEAGDLVREHMASA